jgi:hypothetical protein
MYRGGNMVDGLNKKQVELQIFGAGEEFKYTGRLLGLLSPKEYAALFAKPELKHKMATVETAPLDVIGKMEDIDGFRLVLAIKKRDDELVSPQRLLFISEPLEHVSSYMATAEVSFASSESYYVATEVDV